jgi:hypothetical protein
MGQELRTRKVRTCYVVFPSIEDMKACWDEAPPLPTSYLGGTGRYDRRIRYRKLNNART